MKPNEHIKKNIYILTKKNKKIEREKIPNLNPLFKKTFTYFVCWRVGSFLCKNFFERKRLAR